MRIGISGTQCIGKSTLIKDFLERWEMYTSPETSYRDVIKEKNLPCNRETTPETQTILMNCIVDQLMATKKSDNIITDRTPYDALVYSMYQHAKGVEGFTEEFIAKQIELAREASSLYDIIFHIPIVKEHDVKLVDDSLRDADPEYREEIDNIFSAIFRTYFEQTGPFFKFGDSPALIEIFGTPKERIAMIEMYVNKDGNAYGEEESMIAGDIVGVDAPEVTI